MHMRLYTQRYPHYVSILLMISAHGYDRILQLDSIRTCEQVSVFVVKALHQHKRTHKLCTSNRAAIVNINYWYLKLLVLATNRHPAQIPKFLYFFVFFSECLKAPIFQPDAVPLFVRTWQKWILLPFFCDADWQPTVTHSVARVVVFMCLHRYQGKTGIAFG